jgi:Rrf2 family protein
VPGSLDARPVPVYFPCYRLGYMPGLFRVSARLHNALLLMTEIASRDGAFVSLQDVADRMNLSQGYLEEVAGALKQAGLIKGKKGPAGGYALAKVPSDIALADIVVAVEGPVKLVECQGSTVCPMAGKCPSKNVWSALQTAIEESLARVTLDQLV